jgi:hypothetical protein
MNGLISLISGLASGETAAMVRRVRVAATAYAIAALAALCGVGFLIGAGFIWTSRNYGPFAAALGFGIGFLVLASVVVVVFRLSARAQARKQAKQRRDDMAAIAAAAALAALPTLLLGKGGLGSVLGPVAALAAYAIYRENSRPGNDNAKDVAGKHLGDDGAS